MNWKRTTALLTAAAMTIPTCLSGAGTLEVRAEGMVTEAQLGDYQTAAPKADEVVPNIYQYQYQKEELAAFCHFGMNTFTDSEWGNGWESPSSITLMEHIDADNFVKTLKDAGFEKLIITAKHHDGFCIWDSAYTEHDIAQTQYPGDVLEDFSIACTKYDMDMGLYLSPWDMNSQAFGYFNGDGTRIATKIAGGSVDTGGRSWEQVEEQDVYDYNEYYDNQLREILSNEKYGNNGVFKEVWMDGANGDTTGTVQYYNFNKWYNTIQEYEGIAAGKEADCMVFGMDGYTTVRWIGNESGFANEETWSKSKSIPFETYMINSNNGGQTDGNSIGSYTKGYPDGNQWTVPEVDARITDGWFWHAGQAPKSLEALSDMYFSSVGHNAPLLLNVPLNNQGKAEPAALERVTEFGTAIRDTFRINYAANDILSASAVRGNDIAYSPQNLVDGNDDTYWTVDDGTTTGKIEIPLGATRSIDVVSIEEAIQFGQRITGFKVEYSNQGGAWSTFDEGTTIGAKRLCRRTPVKADKVRITIKGTTGAVPMLSEVGVYKAAEGFETLLAIPDCLTVVNQDDNNIEDGNGFTYTGWTQESNDSMIGGNGMYANAGAEFTFTFTGTKAWLFGTMGDPNHGTADIYLDGSAEVAKTIDASGSSRKLNKVIYETPDMEYGRHTIRLVAKTKATGIQGAGVLANDGQGMFEFAQSKYQVAEGVNDFVEFTVKRIGGSAGKVSVQFEVNPGSAMQADFDADARTTLEFEDGETEKKVRVAIKRNHEDERTLEDFTAEIVPVQGADVQADIGFVGKSTVTIYESQEQAAQELLNLIVKAKSLNGGSYTSATYAPMKSVLKKAMVIVGNMDAIEERWIAAKAELQTAVDELVLREGITEEDPFLFPATEGENSLAEAEYFILDSTGAGAGEEVRVIDDEQYSNGKGIDGLNNGNKILMPFTARKAGTYTFTAAFQSGSPDSNPNKFNWSGTNVTPGSIDVSGDETLEIQKLSFDVNIKQPGNGVLIFSADAGKSPRTDCFEIIAKDLETGTFIITAFAGEHGIISDVGETEVNSSGRKTYTITPDTGYEIKDVLVNGASVGAVSSYTFENLTDDAIIEAIFQFSYYTASNPAQLRGAEATEIEAEYFELVETPVVAGNEVRITPNARASNKKEVNWFEEGNKIRLVFEADYAGTYHVTATYRSGRIQGSHGPNAFEWSGTHVDSGSQDVYGEDEAVNFHTAEFDIAVTEAGVGELVFTASAKAGPVMDKFIFECKDFPVINPVTGVSLNKTEATLTAKGQSIQLTETVAPEDATNKKVTWKSSNPSAATVNASGLVTAAGNGTAVITVTTEDGEKKAACEVKVEIPAETVSVTGVSLNKAEATLTAKGQTVQLTETIAPENATNKKVTWKSSNPSAAVVNAGGLVTAAGNGSAVITVTTEDGKKTAACEVTVKIPLDPEPQPAKPAKVTGVKTGKYKTKSFTVTWDKQDQADSYRVYLQNGKKWEKARPVKNNKLTIKKLKPGTKYSVRVEAVNKLGTGGKSAILKTATKPEKPALKLNAVGAKAVKISLEKVKASKYQIWMKEGKQKFKIAKSISTTKWTQKKLKPGKKYTFKVRAYVKNGSAIVYGAYAQKSITLKK